MLTFIAVWHDS